MRLLITIALFLTMTLNMNASDKNGINDISFAYGESSENIDIYRLSVKKELNEYFFEKDSWYLPSYYETSFGYWKANSSGNLKSLAFTPMFRYTFLKENQVKPYVELGVGATYISKTELEDENFGMHFQFENVFGIGFKLYDFDIAYRYIHYSNAGLHDNNSGIDFNLISISYKF